MTLLKMTDVSICLVSWNTRDYLGNVLRSIYRNTKARVEVVVVDNASCDGSEAMVQEYFPQVRLIVNNENRYLSAALNQALSESTGKYIMLLGSDVIVMPSALDLMLEYLNDQSEVGAVGGKIVNPGGSIQLTCARTFPTLFSEIVKGTSLDTLFPKNRVFGKYLMSWWNHDDSQDVDLLDAACMMVRREAVEEVGLLDEGFPLYSQDLDWCYRIKLAGWRIHYLSKAEIFHYAARSVCQMDNGDVKWSVVECRRSMLRFFRKHYGFWTFQLLRLVTIVGLAAKLIIWRTLSPFSNTMRCSLKEQGSAYWEIVRMCMSSRLIFSLTPINEQRGLKAGH